MVGASGALWRHEESSVLVPQHYSARKEDEGLPLWREAYGNSFCLNFILGQKVANKKSRGMYFKQEYQILDFHYSYNYEKILIFKTW